MSRHHASPGVIFRLILVTALLIGLAWYFVGDVNSKSAPGERRLRGGIAWMVSA